MSRAPFIRTTLFALIGLLAAALAATSAGHTSPRISDPSYEAYLLSGGSPEDLCDADFHGTTSHECPVCTLTGKALLPSLTVAVAWQARVLDASAIRPPPPCHTGSRRQPYAARGPPVPI